MARNLLSMMTADGWALAERWVDFDEGGKPVVRFIKDNVLVPKELAGRIAYDPAWPQTPSVSQPTLGLNIFPVFRGSPDEKFSFRLDGNFDSIMLAVTGSKVPITVCLSASEDELTQIADHISKYGGGSKHYPDPETIRHRTREPRGEAEETGSAHKHAGITFAEEPRLSPVQEEQRRKRLLESMIRDDIKQKIFQQAISLGGKPYT
jgi:hypothetical protein